jgi:D-alanyl-D-alanine carboxypeptidase/D-alanyl-D-alanine-endopeptidase (penicillin-binding protein 4)
MARGVWGVDIRSLDTGEQIYSRDAGRLMMPASNMKIVTLAAAAEVLGWDHRFTTTLETSAPVEDGVLKGDLYVRGGGDPTINARDRRAPALLNEWTVALRAAGIREVAGRIVGDDQIFDDEGIGQGWAWDYLQFGYAAPVGALQFNENMARLTIAPGSKQGEPADVSLSAGAGLRLLNRVTTVASDGSTDVSYRRRLDEPVLEVTGSIPAGAVPLERTVAVVNPTIFFAQSLKEALTERGIRVDGPAVDFDDIAAELLGTRTERRLLARTESPTLREIGSVLMKASQNLYAETLVKAIGAARGGLGTFEGGLSAVRGLLTAWEVPGDEYVLADGSGLSRYNYITARAVTALLERMFKDTRHHDPFYATLPVAGKDGTIATRLRRTRAEGNAVAKTGSISNVRSLSGYVRTRDGEVLVFAILANDFVIPAATVNWIADLAVEHMANFTRQSARTRDRSAVPPSRSEAGRGLPRASPEHHPSALHPEPAPAGHRPYRRSQPSAP